MAKKIIFLAIISLFLFSAFSDLALAAKSCTGDDDCPAGLKCRPDPYDESGAKKICARPLEIIYPPVPGGGAVPDTTATGLPQYVKYIFQLSVVVIGFIIFAVLIKSGIQYLISTGNTAMISNAKEGIFSAFLGAIILLSAYIIFNTINPQLTILKLAEVSPLGGVAVPGVYICNYKADNIDSVITRYLQAIPPLPADEAAIADQIEATKELRKIMANPEKGQFCPRANFSGNFDNFAVNQNNTIFIVPSLSYAYNNAGERENRVKYEFGIVLHEKDNFGGQCAYYPKPDNGLLYTSLKTDGTYIYNGKQIDNYKAEGLGFAAKSVTVFKKPSQEPSGDAKGIILYKCLDYSRTGMCPEGVTGNENGDASFGTGGADVREVSKSELKEKPAGLAENTRSIKIDPKGSYFALFFENEDFGKTGGKCEVMKSNDPNIMDKPIGRCGACTALRNVMGWIWWGITLGKGGTPDCYPCLKSMIVTKGEAL